MKQKPPAWLLKVALDLKHDSLPTKQKYESWYGFVPTPKQPVLFLHSRALAAQLGVCVKTLERMRQEGSGPPFLRCGHGAVRYPLVELDQWVRQRVAETMGKKLDEVS